MQAADSETDKRKAKMFLLGLGSDSLLVRCGGYHSNLVEIQQSVGGARMEIHASQS